MLNTSYVFTHPSSSPRHVPPGQFGVKQQLRIYSFFFFLLLLHPDRYHQVNLVLNTNNVFIFFCSSSPWSEPAGLFGVQNHLLTQSLFFFFALTRISRLILCSKPLLPYPFFFFLLHLHSTHRNHQINKVLKNQLITHSSSSFFFLSGLANKVNKVLKTIS